MQEILEAIQAGASGDDIANLPIPESYRAAHVLRAEQEMWAGVASEDKDPRQSLHVGDVATPEIAPDEVYLAVMASSINFNTVWTSIFEPLSTFNFLDRLGKESEFSGNIIAVGGIEAANKASGVGRAMSRTAGVGMDVSAIDRVSCLVPLGFWTPATTAVVAAGATAIGAGIVEINKKPPSKSPN